MKKLFLILFAATIFVACGNRTPQVEPVVEDEQVEAVIEVEEPVVEEPVAATHTTTKPSTPKTEPAKETPAVEEKAVEQPAAETPASDKQVKKSRR